MSLDFNLFSKKVLDADLGKVGQAASFIWWAEQHDGKPSVSMQEISGYFVKARLVPPNRTRMEGELRKSKHVIRVQGSRFQPSHDGIQQAAVLFPEFFVKQKADDLISDFALDKCPYIADSDIADAKTMAELYIVLFSLENSIRRHIENVLFTNIGPDWWDKAASASMKRKESERRTNETQNKWIPSRANSGPLYSLDWSDLVTLMRKHEEMFRPSISNVNFLHRFEDLGNLRNVVAHNGVIGEPMQFARVKLAFHDWVRQVSV
jgi:hypothetical protein